MKHTFFTSVLIPVSEKNHFIEEQKSITINSKKYKSEVKL